MYYYYGNVTGYNSNKTEENQCTNNDPIYAVLPILQYNHMSIMVFQITFRLANRENINIPFT